MKLKRISMSKDFLMEMLIQDNLLNFRVASGLPENTEFCYVVQSSKYMIDFVVSHDSFEDLKDGDEIPVFKIEFWKL